jgi:hypothetical protein
MMVVERAYVGACPPLINLIMTLFPLLKFKSSLKFDLYIL